MIPQVGGVGAEEDEVALDQLQESETKRFGYLLVSCPLSSVARLHGAIYSHPGAPWMTADMRGPGYTRTEIDLMQKAESSETI